MPIFPRMKSFFSFLGCFSFLFFSCTPELERPEISTGSASVNRFLVMGDSYMSGYSDGALYRHAQERSTGALIHRSLEQAGSGAFVQALMPEGDGLGRNPKQWLSQYVSKSKLGDRTDCEGVVSMGPVKSEYNSSQAQTYLDALSLNEQNDLSVPFLTLNESLFSGGSNEYLSRFCSTCTNGLREKINSYAPDFFAAWFGMEEVFRYARNGGFNSALTDAGDFSSALDTLLLQLSHLGAQGVLATVPDFRSMPFYTLIPWNGADLSQDDADSLTSLYASSGMGHIAFSEGKNGFVIEDPAAPGGYRQMHSGEYLLLTVPLDSMKCHYYGIMVNPIHDRYVLDSGEVALIDQTIAQYNALLAQKAAQYNLALCDMHAYFNQIQSGQSWNGVSYTTEFVSGAFFSLDGFHPTEKAANLLANRFILAINAHYGSSFPTVYCEDCNGVLFP